MIYSSDLKMIYIGHTKDYDSRISSHRSVGNTCCSKEIYEYCTTNQLRTITQIIEESIYSKIQAQTVEQIYLDLVRLSGIVKCVNYNKAISKRQLTKEQKEEKAKYYKVYYTEVREGKRKVFVRN